ncbi:MULTISPECIES: hypothetical protein [Pseudomonadaceae]|uniref:Uncharacterized protein n=1 Tax=Aquipseudomonas alcaligenes TaxID=43263 RepID=A0AA37CK67_AQUAC|nr:hypothetical protein [Pseudomonas alcaligenes]EKX3868176.1 hypothetical protein [Pseudomonas aeruginosa]BCR23452.1 hypothetical protein KAM426_09790 [Pseudomonas alcaligenes]GIZ73353.1 hypothetical protein KAM429_41140 [Pseudomonas alcaligenes]GIZ77726.1 hypothetical protein KAM430_41350 [Pseudomonas alcaligenes]GIZ82048.1 hypothetical protein KAM432_40960 [Pseudomonas alcaligenes]
MNQKLLLTALLGTLLSSVAQAGTSIWTASYTQGVEEHLVDDGNGNQLNITCPDDGESAVSAYATIAGKQYSSENDGFDVIVDGTTFSNPFYTDCEACSASFPGFWAALRKANSLQLSAGGQTVKLPTQNLPQVLQPLTSKKNLCRSGW